MNDPADTIRPVLEIRKYSNRRYYDSTRSCHVTLEEIHGLIQAGHEIRVTDSQSGEDITSKVLAQIILDYDPPKLDAFPAAMLHEVIRSNETLVKEFIDKYFSQAFQAFLDSQRQFDAFMRQAMGLGRQGGAFPDMVRMMSGVFWPPFMPGHAGPGAAKTDEGNADPQKLRERIEQLHGEMERLKTALDETRSRPS